MTGSKDPRDYLRINIPLEEALKIGKLLGSQYGAVALCRDGHRSSQMIEQALTAGIISTGGEVYLAGACPAPAMPYMRTGCDCYVSIAADDPEQISGINIHNPDGSYFDETQVHALLSKEERIYYPEYSELGQVHKIYGISGRYIEGLGRLVKRCNCQFVLDGTHQLTTAFASRILEFYDSESILISRTKSSVMKAINEYNYYDVVHAMESYPWSLGASLNNDGSKLVMFDEKHRRIPSMTLGAMLAEITGASQVTASLDISLAVDDAIGPGGVVVRSDRNIKHVVDHMVANKSGLGMDTHGRMVFADLSYTPDAIAAMLMLGEHSIEERLSDFVDRIPVYPRFTSRIPTMASDDELRKALDIEISSAEYESIIRMDGIRLEFSDGWILFDVNCQDHYVDITCESRDAAYAITLMDIAKAIVNAAIRELD